ncbi:MAG TPA: fatty acid-binding protein DegV [Clostridium sp.]|nr:fatty acid-binding protein DegV [Clostridium sp.]
MNDLSKYILLAETGSDLPKEIAERYNIYIVPMHVSLGDETLDDGAFPVEEICNYYARTKKLPKTSGSSPEDFNVIFDKIHDEWPDKHIIYLAYSAVTTCSYQSGCIASEDRDYVTSIDTQQVSAGQTAVIYETAKLLEEQPHITLEELIKAVEVFCKRTKMCFVPDELEYLRAGGRVSNAVAMGGKLLSIHPAIEIEDGYLIAKKKYRGRMDRVGIKLVKDFTEKHNLQKDHIWLLWAIGLSEEIRRTIEQAARDYGYEKITWIQTGCVITTHGGPGAFGLVGLTNQ